MSQTLFHKALLAVSGFVLSFLLRGVPYQYRESRSIAMITYNLVLVGGIAVLLTYLINLSELAGFLIRTIAILLLSVMSLGLLFVPKVDIPTCDPNPNLTHNHNPILSWPENNPNLDPNPNLK
jgi:hypothetical protein